MILTPTEISECLTGGPTAVARAIEAAVLTKLSQGVSVEPDIHHWYHPKHDAPDYVKCVGYTADQLHTAIAAARVQALEDAAVVCENESCSCCWTEDATEMASHLQDAIRALKGGAA